jgi:NACalpha-BTF3-like transcription factor
MTVTLLEKLHKKEIMMNDNKLLIENAKLIFRNFSGRPEKYNADGKKQFSVFIEDPDRAQQLTDNGWNVHVLKPREEGDEPSYILPVFINFRSKKQAPQQESDENGNPRRHLDPDIYIVKGNKKTRLSEDEIGVLDYAECSNIDLFINPSYWKKDDGSSGIKAYLDAGYFTLYENELDVKYANLEEDTGSENA